MGSRPGLRAWTPGPGRVPGPRNIIYNIYIYIYIYIYTIHVYIYYMYRYITYIYIYIYTCIYIYIYLYISYIKINSLWVILYENL